MKKLIIIFLVSSVQAIFAMQFPITAEIKKNMKELHPFTLHSSHPGPRVEDCKAHNRILIARVDAVFCRHRYLRFETDEQVDQLVNQIPEETKMQTGEVWKIEWFYYDPVEEVTPPSTSIASSSISDNDQNAKLDAKNKAVRRFHLYIRYQDEHTTESLCASDDNPYLLSYEDVWE